MNYTDDKIPISIEDSDERLAAALVVLFRFLVEVDRNRAQVLALLHELVEVLATLHDIAHILRHNFLDI